MTEVWAFLDLEAVLRWFGVLIMEKLGQSKSLSLLAGGRIKQLPTSRHEPMDPSPLALNDP